MPSADKLYRKILTSALVKSKFFSRGWGDVDTYRALLQLREAITSRREGNLLISSCPTDISLKKVHLVSVGDYWEILRVPPPECSDTHPLLVRT